MAIKSPPRLISPLAGCRELLQLHPRTRVRDDGTSGCLLWKIRAAPMFLGFSGFYRRRSEPRRWTTGRGGSHLHPPLGHGRGPPAPCGSPPRLPFGLQVSYVAIKNLYKFSSNSENISRSKFLKYKNSKNRELALGILSIG